MGEAIERVAVIGAGTMGAGIAAQVANAGTPVLLLDFPGVAEAALARLAGSGAFMHRDAQALLQPGNSEDLAPLAGCDWIVEAIVERLDAKQALYRRIDAVRRPGAAVSSNTSTIALSRLVDGLPDDFARAFLVTHFFNPPRQMRLLELVTGAATDPALAARVGAFIDRRMGKTVIACHDTPGFIANRIGAFWMLAALAEAVRRSVGVEAADAVLGKPFGIPATGAFGLMDLIGVDVMADITQNLTAALPAGDGFHAVAKLAMPWLQRLVAAGRTGRKGGGGFTRLDRATGRRFALDLASGEERPAEPPPASVGRTPQEALQAPAPLGAFAAAVMGRTLAYAAGLVPEAAESVADIDAAMRLGYNWQHGPFELLDRLGSGLAIERLQADGAAVPPLLREGLAFYREAGSGREARAPGGDYAALRRPDGVLLLSDARGRAPVLQGAAGALWDIGEGVACFEATTKMGTLDESLFELLQQVIAIVPSRFRALVVGHDGAQFSAGANLSVMLQAAQAGDMPAAERLVLAGQRAMKALKYAPFPVVVAPFGLALGGGCELVLAADAVQAHAELTIGLVECNVGLIPGWGGCGEMLQRLGDPAAVFALVQPARTSGSAAQARSLGFLRPDDGITMNRDRLLADARARAIALVAGYGPPSAPVFDLPGRSGIAALLATLPEQATEHDRMVAEAFAGVLAGHGPATTEAQLLDLECQAFLRLLATEASQARIDHVLRTGKPLRN